MKEKSEHKLWTQNNWITQNDHEKNSGQNDCDDSSFDQTSNKFVGTLIKGKSG